MGTPLTASVVAVVFGTLSVWFAGRLVTGRDVPDRISNLLHLLMSAAMAVMPYSWAAPALPQVVVFSAGAFWYAGAALFRPAADAGLGVGHGAHGRVAGLWYHAGMLLAMVWMAVAMIPASAGDDAAGMAGMSGMGHAHAAGAGGLTGDAPWALAISIALGALFAGAAVWLAGLLIREAAGAAHRLEIADLTASTLMAAGMSFALLAVMT
ncbi:DUF5134 domain-containing protein [Amnibacterium kyonggiense]|uniref:Uncharacterized protein DUF5134 n=1 Tax=Amnibacterium kyonggiense TaxID=595671 RepID=A0A4V3EBG5_9MICO|nr:DUF5134 domain-containing protein [Amnibacterium kyonggiense]TDS80484.1 uncharacterized protein DUF5134 [Amnibacterium kyonggiense]